MSDIRTYWIVAGSAGDWVAQNGDLADGDDLDTAVYISLFSDRLARADDDFDGTDRRGWWGDAGQDYDIGSRLWLLYRRELSWEVAGRAEDYAQEALQWLMDDSIVAQVSVSTRIIYPRTLILMVVLTRPDGTTRSISFDWAWSEMSNAV
ncbi:phage GP46 family protein [Citrobacter freundii]|uniref:phage GP46 family protein n=1 Tax=Citrobacter freundii TaxID=546 RepID=UPI001BCAA7EE|nr:phage GP46 family protein [Citrobacter freundii]HBU6168906.1 phage GP46 family protein [Citrobacter freundii]HBV8021132.1 phage GP46 family protein [Citrobacter freundii]HEG1872472.1 phage GP46 family protein [Citrobacter freundii]